MNRFSLRRRCRLLGIGGLLLGAALAFSSCGGDDEPATPTTPEPAAEAPSETESTGKTPVMPPVPPGSKEKREAGLAKLGAEHQGAFEEDGSGAIRYTGQTGDGGSFKAQMGGEVDIPEGFFDELPLYPDGVPFSMMDAGDGMALVSVDYTEDTSDLYEFYKAKLNEGGWVIENDFTMTGGRVLRALRDERRAVLHFQEIEGGTRIGFMLADEP